MSKPTIKGFIGERVSYDKEGQYFWGVSPRDGQQMVAQLRGWGAIQNLFKTKGNYDLEAAAKFQDEVGKFIADAINEKLEREKE